jgi:hypothetical protein
LRSKRRANKDSSAGEKYALLNHLQRGPADKDEIDDEDDDEDGVAASPCCGEDA